MQHDGTLITRIAFTLNSVTLIQQALHSRVGDREYKGRAARFVGPDSEIEAWLAELWCQVLRLSRISVHDNFFELGGSSLQATQIVAQIRRHFHTDFSLNIIFEHAAIIKLARVIEKSCSEQGSPAPEIIEASEARQDILSYAQQPLFFLHRWESEAATYNIPVAFKLCGPIDLSLLEQCICEIADRHEPLITTFTVAGNTARSVLSKDAGPLFFVDKFKSLAGDDRSRECLSRLRKEVRKGFDLENGPLLRVMAIQVDEQETLLLFNMHHIISDGWSLGILFRELSVLYDARLAGKAALLPDLPLRYSDYACWQRQWLRGEAYAAQLGYWKSMLSGELPLLCLPTDRPRPASRRSSGDVCRSRIDAGLRDQLETLCREKDVTLFMGLLSVFYVLLNRYSHQNDIIIGTPIANRNHPGTEDLIGYFTNTLALRADLSGDLTFDALLGQVRELSLDAYANQDVPFEQVVTELDLERDLSRTPVFQVMFVFQNAQYDTLKLAGTTISPLDVHTETAKFDLTLEVTQTERGLNLVWEYDTALFDRVTIERMQRSFHVLLGGLQQQHALPVSRLSILDPAEQLALLGATSLELVEYPDSRTLVDLFEEQTDKWPGKAAVTFGLEELTYAMLNCRANQLAHYLLGHGVQPGNLVGLCLERSVDLVIGVLGILKTGAGYVPLDPAYPQDRLHFMLDDAQVNFVVTQSGFTGLVHGNRQLVSLDTDKAVIEECSASNPRVAFTQEQLAYIIYTSGSTGQPKGVAITHQNVTRLFSSTEAWFDFNEQDIWTLFHSYAFDFTVWELWGALLHGGKLIIVPFEVTRSPEAFHRLLTDERVTVLNQTPTAFSQLVRVDSALGPESGNSSLRYVIFGGEALDIKSLRPWFDRHGDESPRLINMYGITETTVHVTLRPLSVCDLDSAANSAIGIPIPDLQCIVLDGNGQLLPIGVAGELHVGGAGLARGYLNRPGLTAWRFIPDPYASRPGQRLYRTGDLVRKLQDGSLDYLGRIDHQVQLRGFRIELGEIESAISSQDDVLETVVLVKQDATGFKQLVAYLVARQPLSVDALREALKKILPGYMIPSAFVFMDQFPLTPNGKLDRVGLPLPTQSRPGLAHDYVAPRTTTEAVLVEIWQEILQVDRVGVCDSFFALGGDSIKSIPLLASIRGRGLGVTLLQLFQEQTIERLAEIADQGGTLPDHPDQGHSASLITQEDREQLPEDVEDAYPLSMLQAGMLFRMAYSPDSRVYHNVTSSTLQTDFDLDAFREAVRRVVLRHDIFRTSFDLTGYSIPLQLVHKSAEVPVDYQDISHLPESAQDTLVERWLEEEKSRAFDISKAPLLRFCIYRRSERLIQFTITECHVLLDGWSENSTLSELWDLHFSLLTGEDVPIQAPPKGTYRDFVALEQQIIKCESHKAFWQKQLADYEPVDLPRWPDHYRSPQPAPVCSRTLWLPVELASGLKQLAITLELPLKSILLAAHLKVISGLTGSRVVTTGLVMHGRPDTEGGETIRGLFLNTLPIHMNLGGDSWKSLIHDVYSKERELFPHRQYPMAQIKKDSGQDHLFETAFGYVHFHVMEHLYRSGKLRMTGEIRRWTPTDFPLMTVFPHDPYTDKLGITLDYDQAVLNRQQIESIGQYYLRVLGNMVDQPGARYDTFCLLPEAEKDQLITGRNMTSRPYPSRATVQELFDRQASLTPDNVALVESGRELTYEGLRRYSNRLANYLVQEGVKPGDRVGVCLQRSISCVAAILGILKAGGSYVPLDPDYPVERLAFMTRDAGVSVILTGQVWEDRLPDDVTQLVYLDKLRTEIEGFACEGPVIHMDSAYPAYVMYTSGSTGIPKGVEVPHRAIVRLVIDPDYVRLGRDETLLMLAPISFDASTFEIWGSLLTGGRLAVMQEPLPTLEAIVQAVHCHQVTTLWLTSGLFHQMVEEKLEALSSLKQLLSGGDVLSVPHVKKVLDSLQNCALINGYGPTEGTTFTCCHTITAEDVHATSIPVGRPIRNTQIYILDPDLNPVPLGVTGELYIGGDGLASAYVDRPALTAERFIPNPFGDAKGTRLYRTGDLVRMQPDGNVDFIGRADRQVKVRGFRIELGEIESRLLEHLCVAEAVVLSRDDLPGTKRLVAYVVPKSGAQINGNALRDNLANTLPGYMIPSSFVLLDELPLTPNGKVDRCALPAPGLLHDVMDVDFVLPASELEKTIATVWQEVLAVHEAGLHDNFFEMGGDSLAATRLISRVHKVTGVALPLSLLFDCPTIAGISTSIERNRIQCLAPDNGGNDREEFEI